MGATSRADNPTEEVILTEEDRTGGISDMVADAAQARYADDSKASTTPTDGGEVVELMRVHNRASATTKASTVVPMVSVCTQVRIVPYR